MTPSARAAVRSSLDRLAAVEPTLHAMVSIDPAGACASAEVLDARATRGPLAGWTVGIKDVADVRGLPTRAGAAVRQDVGPAAADADIVRRLRASDAVIVGKTVTTEFAMMDPAVTRNPWRDDRTPGGSSSGSAAAVGAGALRLAVGTQTAGSLCRPAAYCGISTIKPTYRLLPTDGILPLAPSFDTLGLLARTVTDTARAFEAVSGVSRAEPRPWAIGLPDERSFPDAEPEALDHWRSAARTAEALGSTVVPLEPFTHHDRLRALHRLVMAFEAYAAHGHTLGSGLLGPRIADLLRDGRAVPTGAYRDALAEIEDLRAAHWSGLAGVDAVLTLPVPGVAPSRATTGPAHYLVPWTVLHGPLVVVPGVLSADGLPLATMIASAPGTDALALALALELADHGDRLPAHASMPAAANGVADG